MTEAEQQLARQEERSLRPAGALLGVLFGGAAATAFVLTLSFPQALTARDPGPAVIPRYLSLVVLGLSVALVVSVLVRGVGGWRPVGVSHRPATVLLAFVGYVILLPVAGYVPATVLFVAVVAHTLGVRKTRVALVFATGLAVANFLVFRSLFGIPLWVTLGLG